MSTTDLQETPPAADGSPQREGTAIRTGRAISVVFFMGVAARVLTLISQVLIAATFGTHGVMDAYVLALIVPTTIAGVLSVAVGAAVIPIFIEYRENRSEAEAMHILWAATTLGTVITVMLTGIMVAAAPLLIALFGRGANAETQQLAALLLRFLLPILLLQALVTLFGALLNAYNRFVESSLLPAANAVCIIAFLVLAHAWGIYALAWGTLAGYALNLLLLVIACWYRGLHVHIVFDWRHPAIRRIVVIAAPGLAGSLLAHANILVDQFMTAFLPTGNISSLNYAVKLVDTPSQFFYAALSTALLPVFAIQVARRELGSLRDTFRQIVIFSAIILLPAGALLSVLARPVVQVLLQRASFTANSTELVAGAIAFLAPGMFFVTYSFINARVYQALQDNWTLAYVTILSLVVNGVLDYALMQIWGVAGIAFSTTLTYLITAIVLLLLLERKIHGLRLPQMAVSVGKAVGASALMWFCCAWLEQLSFVERMPLLARIAMLGFIGLSLYVVFLWGLRVREAGDLWALVRSRLSSRRSKPHAV